MVYNHTIRNRVEKSLGLLTKFNTKGKKKGGYSKLNNSQQ